METMKQKNKEKYDKFLQDKKNLVGMSDYKIEVNSNIFKELGEEIGESEARAMVDIIEKEVYLLVTEYFEDLEGEEQKNILFHELIHARYELLNKLKRVGSNEFFEEDFVNDIVRGFEKHKKLKWQDQMIY